MPPTYLIGRNLVVTIKGLVKIQHLLQEGNTVKTFLSM